MYVQRNKSKGKNGKVYRSVLLCTKYREDGKIKTKVEANLSHFPKELIVTIENTLKHGKEALIWIKDVVVKKSIDYGLVYLLIHLMDKLRISATLEKAVPDHANLLKAIIIGKIVTRGSKLGIYNWLKRNEKIASKLEVDISSTTVDDLYYAMGQASYKQHKIEHKWNIYNKTKHKDVFLYDITSTYFEGNQNELSAFGYNRDNKKGKKQINIGLVTDSKGLPLKVEVFKGNINDHKTVTSQIQEIKDNMHADQVIFVGDRGMKIRYNLEDMAAVEKQGVHYITGLTHQEIVDLMDKDAIQLQLFSKDLADIEYENHRYILSINPTLQEKELAYLKTMRSLVDEDIAEVKASWELRRVKNIENSAKIKNGHKNKKLVTSFSEKKIDRYKLRIERILSKGHFKKYYDLVEISDERFVVELKAIKYQQAKHLAGKYVVCTNVTKERMDTQEVRQQYKNLQQVEHAFRDFKSENIQIRPVYHRNAAQTRGHVLLSMFSYAIIKEMENKIFPFLKIWNKNENQRLSFSDILEELRDIKLCVLQLGKNIDTIQITQLNEMQKQILDLFNMRKQDLDKKL